MNYKVYPRDLFNDANLLYQLGKLYTKLENMNMLKHWVRHMNDYEIQQDINTGDTYTTDIQLVTEGDMYLILYRPLNCKDRYNLYTDIANDTIYVFTDDGELTEEFIQLLKSKETL